MAVPHRLLNGTIVFADMVNDARDAEGSNKAQQISQEAESDTEDETSAESFPQGQPDPLWTLGCCALRTLKRGEINRKGMTLAC